jgi:hypothetical protein
MIHFDFDREKLTPREAQIVSGIILAVWDARTYMLRGAHVSTNSPPEVKRKSLEGAAEKARKALDQEFPDLAIRWEWREPPATTG